MGKRPVIGITPGFLRDRNKLALGQGYVNGVIKAGGIPVILPLCTDNEVIGRILDISDGILFSGGGDVDARYFGEENRKYGGEITPERDGFELLLAKRAIAGEMPILGICRGMQVINIAAGGTIFQDIYYGRQTADVLKHWQEAPDWYPVHDIQIKPCSKLHDIFNKDVLGVNSFHHQAVKDTGSGLEAVATASDGIIEAVEGTGDGFIAAVQWHPELMWQEDQAHLGVFKAFTDAAAVFSQVRVTS